MQNPVANQLDSRPLSLYLHIPFCSRKCAYCSFAVITGWSTPISDTLKDNYTDHIIREIKHYASSYAQRPLYTIYIWGGTPTLLGPQRLIQIIDVIAWSYQIDRLWELTIECNPDQSEYVLDTIRMVHSHYPYISCIRRSIGIQTWDQDILTQSSRWYNNQTLVHFIDALVWLKSSNTSYNMDLIAFGKLYDSLPWSEQSRAYRSNLLHSHFLDHCSIYTLELFEWSQRYHELIQNHNPDQIKQKLWHGLKKYGSDDEVYQEFDYLASLLIQAGYRRYELSNFSLSAKKSQHNQVYRKYGDYLGIGMSSSSKIWSHRRSNYTTLSPYMHHDRIDPKTIQYLTHADQLIESFFLRLRTEDGIDDLWSYTSVLEPDYQIKLANYYELWYVHRKDDVLSLTYAGMNIYNYIITDLLHTL